jgi:hypothetical protein
MGSEPRQLLEQWLQIGRKTPLPGTNSQNSVASVDSPSRRGLYCARLAPFVVLVEGQRDNGTGET